MTTFCLMMPTDHIMYEAHQYFDLDHSGTYKVGYTLNGVSPDRSVEWVRPFAEWLELHQVRGIISEFGVPGDDPRWLELTRQLLAYLAKRISRGPIGQVDRGGEITPFPPSRRNGVDAPIMSVLTKDYGMLRNRPSR